MKKYGEFLKEASVDELVKDAKKHLKKKNKTRTTAQGVRDERKKFNNDQKKFNSKPKPQGTGNKPKGNNKKKDNEDKDGFMGGVRKSLGGDLFHKDKDKRRKARRQKGREVTDNAKSAIRNALIRPSQSGPGTATGSSTRDSTAYKSR